MSKFCVIPWISITSDNKGLVRPCCKFAEKDKQDEYQTPSLKDHSYADIWNGPEFQKIRQAFLDGKEIPECSSCWNEEVAGHTSYRQTYNKQYGHIANTESIIAEAPKVIDLKLSNVCNFKCRMCDYTHSSLILKEDKKYRGYEVGDEKYYLSNKILETENQETFLDEWLPHMLRIEFTGGEPFVSPEAKKLIQIISETEYAKQISICIITNGSTINKKILDQLSKFKVVMLGLSIDDIGSRAEYQRNGTVWSDIEKNIKTFSQYKNFSQNIHCTVNNYSVYGLKDLLKFGKENNIKVVLNILHGPERLSVKHLSPSSKKFIENRIGDEPELKSVVKYMYSSDEDLTQDFIYETEWIDTIRKENFKDVFPEWSKVIYDSV